MDYGVFTLLAGLKKPKPLTLQVGLRFRGKQDRCLRGALVSPPKDHVDVFVEKLPCVVPISWLTEPRVSSALETRHCVLFHIQMLCTTNPRTASKVDTWCCSNSRSPEPPNSQRAIV